MRTHNIPYVKENQKDISIKPLDLALSSTLTGSNYPCLELIFMVPKLFEPLKFDCTCTVVGGYQIQECNYGFLDVYPIFLLSVGMVQNDPCL